MEPRPVLTVLPEWLIRDLEEPMRLRRTVDVEVGYREGTVLGTTINRDRRGPPIQPDAYPEPLLCPRGGCGERLVVLDSGRRFLCPRCDLVWLEREFRAEAKGIARGG